MKDSANDTIFKNYLIQFKKGRQFIVFLLFVMLISACTPSFSKLLIYEETAQIQEMGLVVDFPDAFAKNNTMSKLYAKYGYEERAARIAEDKKKQEIWIRTAFLEKFSYCKVYFAFDSLPTAPPHYHIYFEEIDKVVSEGSRGEYNSKALALKIYSADPAKPLADAFPSSFEATSYGYTLQNYRQLVTQLQRKLEKYDAARKKAIKQSVESPE